LKTLKEVVFSSRDNLSDMASMLQLVEQTVSNIEHSGEDVAVKGSSSILWSVIEKMAKMEKDMSETLKGV